MQNIHLAKMVSSRSGAERSKNKISRWKIPDLPPTPFTWGPSHHEGVHSWLCNQSKPFPVSSVVWGVFIRKATARTRAIGAKLLSSRRGFVTFSLEE
jgi:hypothetical protein